MKFSKIKLDEYYSEEGSYLKAILRYMEEIEMDIEDFKIEYLSPYIRLLLKEEAENNKSIKFEKTENIMKLL